MTKNVNSILNDNKAHQVVLIQTPPLALYTLK